MPRENILIKYYKNAYFLNKIFVGGIFLQDLMKCYMIFNKINLWNILNPMA